jgi:hypothetical protein
MLLCLYSFVSFFILSFLGNAGKSSVSLSLAIWYAGEMHLGHETQMWFIGGSSSKSGTFASGFQLVKTWKLVPLNFTFFLNDYSSSFLFIF